MNAESTKAIVTLVVTVIVNVLNAAGYALDYDMLYKVGFSLAALACVGVCWWKNQNMTEAAQQAQEYLDGLKAKEE